jgi:hypothetical protein
VQEAVGAVSQEAVGVSHQVGAGREKSNGGQGTSQDAKSSPAFFVPLMVICKVDTPVVKRVPNAQRSNFATAWGRLLDEAVVSTQEAAWSEFFLFPKCILWTPVRGGKRGAKKANMAELVRDRLARWSAGEKQQLWKDAEKRAKKRRISPEPAQPQSDAERLESTVLVALRMGDIRKALQLLNSAPIAPKTDATLERMRKLHPVGENPPPTAPYEPPRFTEEVVRTA